MKRMNRVFSILLILAVILTSMPVGVMAETETVQTDPVILLEDEAAVISAEGPDAAVEEEPEMDLFDALADQEETELPGITVEPEITLEPEITAETGKPEETEIPEEIEATAEPQATPVPEGESGLVALPEMTAEPNADMIPVEVETALGERGAEALSVDVSDLYADGVCLSAGKGTGWLYEDGVFTVIAGYTVTLSGTGVLNCIKVGTAMYEDPTLVLSDACVTLIDEVGLDRKLGTDVNISLVGENSLLGGSITEDNLYFSGTGSLECTLIDAYYLYITDCTVYAETIDVYHDLALTGADVSCKGAANANNLTMTGSSFSADSFTGIITQNDGALTLNTFTAASSYSAAQSNKFLAGTADIARVDASFDNISVEGGSLSFEFCNANDFTYTSGAVSGTTLMLLNRLKVSTETLDIPNINTTYATINGTKVTAQYFNSSMELTMNGGSLELCGRASGSAWSGGDATLKNGARVEIDAATVNESYVAADFTGVLNMEEGCSVDISILEGTATKVTGISASDVTGAGSIFIVNNQTFDASEVMGVYSRDTDDGDGTFDCGEFSFINRQPSGNVYGVRAASVQMKSVSSVEVVSEADVSGSFTGIYGSTDLRIGKEGSMARIAAVSAADFDGLYSGSSLSVSGTVDISVDNAFDATGVYAYWSMSQNGNLSIDLSANGDNVYGIKCDKYASISGPTSISLNGGASSVGIYVMTYCSAFSNSIDIRVCNAREFASAMYCGDWFAISEGKLTIECYYNDVPGFGIVAGNFSATDSELDILVNTMIRGSEGTLTIDGTTYGTDAFRIICKDGVAEVDYDFYYLTVSGTEYPVFPGVQSASGDGWSFDADERALTLNSFDGGDIDYYEEDGETFTVKVTGTNRAGYVSGASNALTVFTGDGSLEMDHARHSDTALNGVDASDVKFESGVYTITGWTNGVFCEDFTVEAAELNISGCTIGVNATGGSISEDAAMSVNADYLAVTSMDGVTLAGEATDLEGFNRLVISGGVITEKHIDRALKIDGQAYYQTDLSENIEAENWKWIASENMLAVSGDVYSVSYAGEDVLRLRADDSVWMAQVMADRVRFDSPAGCLMMVDLLSCRELTVDSGIFTTGAADGATVLNSLTVNGGEIEGWGLCILGDISINGGYLYAIDDLMASDVNVKSGGLYMPYSEETLYADNVRVSGGVCLLGNVSIGGNLNITDGVFEAIGHLNATDVDISGGDVYVQYNLNTGDIDISGGTLSVCQVLACNNYTQTGGYASLCTRAWEAEFTPDTACVQAVTFSATGGDLRLMNLNSYAPLIMADAISLGGSLTGKFFMNAGPLFDAVSIDIAGNSYLDSTVNALILEKGAVTRMENDTSVAMTIDGRNYTEFQLDNSSFGGYYWYWDHHLQQLTIYDYWYDVGDYWYPLYLYRDATIRFEDSTANNLDMYLYGNTKFVGDGMYEGSIRSQSGNLTFNNEGSMWAYIISENGSVTLNNVNIYDGEIYAKRGSITINNSNVCVSYVDAGKNCTIKNSLVYTTQREGNNDIYARNKLKVTGSVLIFAYRKGANGTSIDKYTAQFQWNYWDRNGIYWDCYSLIKSCTLKKSFTLPETYFYVPRGNKLTISGGKTLYYLGGLSKDGSISGSRKALYSPSQMTISGPAEAVTGGEYKLKLNVNPSASDKSVVWYSSDAYTATVGADNVLRIAPDAFPYTEVTLTAVSLYNNACAATHTVTIIPGAQRIDVRGGNGASDSIELWLDPANKTTKVSASVYPADAQQNVTWKTTNKKIATVSAEGVVTAKAAGTAYVYAVAEDGTEVESERIKVVVKKAPKSVKFTSKTAVLGYDAENGSAMSSQLKVTLSSGSASTIKYKSSKPDVVHVDENGVITAKTTGTAKITASTYNKKSATCTVTVKKAPESISIGAQAVVVAVSDGYTFKPQIPSGSVANWTFDSSNKSVATVDGNGVLTPVSVGETVVTVTAFNGRQDNCTVKVVPDPDGVILKNGDIVLGKGESCYLKPEAVLEGDGETAASFTYKSSSSRVKVGKDGKITASATGTAVITVTTHNDRSVQCTVTVRKAPASVKIIPAKVTLAYDEQLGLGTSEQLAVRLSSGSASKITFTSSNEKAVKVDENGVVKAVGLGQAKITAKAFNGKKATCTVTVRLAPVNMVFDRPVYDVAVNDVITVSAHANEGCHAPGAVYAVRDGNSASIDSVTGLVTPLAIGETIITATAFNGAAGEAVINVVAAPDNITLNAGKITLKVGKKFTILPEVSRADKAPTAASFTYKSSKSSVASVSSSGVITAKKKGTAVITVTTHNGFEAKITVKVK